LKQNRYGEVDGPSWDYLYSSAVSAGRHAGEDASAAVLEWLIRTHGPPIDAANRWYQAVLKPSDRLQALKEAKLAWAKTENPIRPWQCSRSGELLTIRIGDFPIEHLYTVEDSDGDIGVVDDWPPAWTRESWSTDGAAKRLRTKRARAALD
jgi:hypothetical protein